MPGNNNNQNDTGDSTQSYNGTPAQWAADKRGYDGTPEQWAAEKQGYGGTPDEWAAEKAGTPEQWASEKQGAVVVVSQRKSSFWLLAGVLLFLLLLGAIALFLVLNNNSNNTKNNVADVVVTATVAATAAPTPTVAAIDPATAVAAATFADQTAQSRGNIEVEQLYQNGVTAASDSKQWEQAINNLEQVEQSRPNYKDTAAQLNTLYRAEGLQLITASTDAQGRTDLQTLLRGDGYLKKALARSPDNADLKKFTQEAEFYYNGRVQYDSKNWQKALNEFAPLYKLQSDYKDTSQLLYTTYINLGAMLEGQNNAAYARDLYLEAEKLLVNPAVKNNLEVRQHLYDVYVKLGDVLVGQNKRDEALASYQQAAALLAKDNTVSDTAQVNQQILFLQATPTVEVTATLIASPTPTVTATAEATATQLATATRRPTATLQPTATAVPTPTAAPTNTPASHNGCLNGTFNFSPFGVAGTGAGSGPDQGRGTVQGLVVDVNNQPLAGVAILARSPDGAYSYTTQTGGNGRYSFSQSLGRGNWLIAVVNVPGVTVCAAIPATVSVNGQPSSQSEVNFVETQP